MENLNYIHDGCTRTGYIAAVERLHDSLEFRYRPMTSPQRAETLAAVRKAQTPTDGERYAAAGCARQILEWDLKHEKGNTVDVDAKHVLRLQSTMNGKLFAIITGDRASDPKPDADDAGSLDDIVGRMDHALTDTDDTESERLGNSPAG